MRFLIFLFSILSLTIFVGGCTAPQVPLKELVADPERYNGKIVTTEGIYNKGWEWNILIPDVTFSGNFLKSTGQAVRFKYSFPREELDKMYTHDNGAGSEYYAKLKVTGKFDYVPPYSYQITPTKVEIVEWSPMK